MIELMIQVFIEVGMTYWSQGNQLAAVHLYLLHEIELQVLYR